MVKWFLFFGILLFSFPVDGYSFEVKGVKLSNALRLYHVSEYADTRFEHRIKIHKKDFPLWVSNFYQADFIGSKKIVQNKVSAGYSLNKHFNILVEKHHYTVKPNDVYRVGVEVIF